MRVTININCDERLNEFAKKKNMTIEQLAEAIVNNYCACLHKLQCGDIEKAYEEFDGESFN